MLASVCIFSIRTRGLLVNDPKASKTSCDLPVVSIQTIGIETWSHRCWSKIYVSLHDRSMNRTNHSSSKSYLVENVSISMDKHWFQLLLVSLRFRKRKTISLNEFNLSWKKIEAKIYRVFCFKFSKKFNNPKIKRENFFFLINFSLWSLYQLTID